MAASSIRFPSGICALLLATGGAAGAAACDYDQPPERDPACSTEPAQAFQQRIEPLLVDDRVTSCNQCHLSGVDLSAFARETPCKTMACLLEQGLVDLSNPEESRILGWIQRASPDSSLITAEVIEAERTAFLEWIEASARCPEACAGVICGSAKKGPTCSDGTADEPQPPNVERGCSDLEIEQAFAEEIYAWRGRCYPCHFDTELMAAKEAPRWLSLTNNCQTASITTLRRIVALGLMDLADPTQSLLLLKPLDVSAGGVMHGGGAKFSGATDPAYSSFYKFIEYYSRCAASQ